MRRIQVVVRDNGSGMFHEALVELLTSVPEIEVGTCTSEQELVAHLRHQCPRVLIVNAPYPKAPETHQAYLELCPNLVIIAIDPTGAEAIVHLRDLGRDLLIRLIHTLSTDNPIEADYPHFHLLTSATVTALVEELSHDVDTISPYDNTREHLEDIQCWLDLCLLQRLSLEDDGDNNNPSLPFWTMNAKQARNLLTAGQPLPSGEELGHALENLQSHIARREAANRLRDTLPRLLAIIDAFGLSDLERRTLFLVLAPELDSRYARIFGFLNDDLTRRRPTVSLLAQLAHSPGALVWDMDQLINGAGPLARYRLVFADPGDPLPGSDRGLLPAPELMEYLRSETDHTPLLRSHLRFMSAAPSALSEVAAQGLDRQLALWRWEAKTDPTRTPVIQLVGETTTRHWFERRVVGSGDSLLVMDIAALHDKDPEIVSETAYGAARLATLHDAVMLITGFPAQRDTESEPTDLLRALRSLTPRLALHTPTTRPFAGVGEIRHIERPELTSRDQMRLWQQRAQAFGMLLSEREARTIATTIRLDEPSMDAALRLASDPTKDAASDNPVKAIRIAARRIACGVTPGTVRKVGAAFDWNDIVLPDAILNRLRQIPGDVQHASQVLDDWNYRSRMPYGHGVAALFAGPSGTGKTMAAQIIAKDLGVEIFQVDLARTVSKYIGETEKNLDAIFEAAEQTCAVLLFDEADALFGKRTEIRDAHDRYANVEVAYLLQRMEAYAGLAVLTTNMRQNLDKAFTRRLRFVVDFPAPSAGDRQRIWEKVFPDQAPIAEDVDLRYLARRLNLTGGNIQQIAIRAAFAAVTEGKSIEMRHINQATRDELDKLGMPHTWLVETANESGATTP